MLADAAQLAATERTAESLDRLVASGALSEDQRARIAAEDGVAGLTRVLRRAELAGHDPHRVLADAVDHGSLAGSRNLTNVLYSRVRDRHRFDPRGDTWADWTPHTDNPEWRDYLTELARAADDRAAQLGAEAAAAPAPWMAAAFGPVPDDLVDRAAWEGAVGRVAAYREVRGHDDPEEALGPAPKPGQVEQFAAYRATWRALGRPEIDREHLELSNGQLRMRVRAYQRELAAAPRYVSNELAGTREAAATYRQNAAVARAEAETVPDNDRRQKLVDEAAQAAELAELLDKQAEQLQQVDDARAAWLVHTAQTRVQAELSKAELSARDADDDPDDRVTAAEWKAAHDAAQAEDERHRDVTEDDLDRDDERDHLDEPQAPLAETGRRDVREEAAEASPRASEDVVRVPDAAETADSLDWAGQILSEIRYREAADAAEEADHRTAQLTRWHTDDVAAGDQEVREVDSATWGDC